MRVFVRGLIALGAAAACGGVALASPAVAAPPLPALARAFAQAPTFALAPPVAPFRAEALFDPPPRPWLAGHRGVDLVSQVGAPVLAPGGGVVTFAGRVVDRGVVTVDHGALRSSLEPVDAGVTVGTRVAAGDQVGVVGADPGHCAPRACLHWGVREGDAYVDPLDLLRGFGPVVLLPDP